MTDTAPLIVTLGMDPATSAFFDALRSAHFPPERNVLRAHLTLFHRLPARDSSAIRATLRRAAMRDPIPLRVAGVRSLGRGVAFEIQSESLLGVRAGLLRAWESCLSAQDRQAFRPHVTVQNKVEPAKARDLLGRLTATFAPFDAAGTRLELWRYRGGPWEIVEQFPFESPRDGPDGDVG